MSNILCFGCKGRYDDFEEFMGHKDDVACHVVGEAFVPEKRGVQ